jgi:uncharacterized protein YdbL (DUF1318 family)
MKYNMRKLSIALAALALVSGAGSVALAQSAGAKAVVDAGKAQGQVGEQADGFLGVVTDGGPDLRAAVAEINAGRAQAYRDAAAKTGVSPAAAGEATARQLFARLPAGAYYKPASGAWTRK